MLDKAKADPAIAQRLLADPNGLLAEVIGSPIAPGVLIEATRGADETFTLSARQDFTTCRELDETQLDHVVGGATAIEYGLIASLIGISVITEIGSLSTGTSSTKFGSAVKIGG